MTEELNNNQVEGNETITTANTEENILTNQEQQNTEQIIENNNNKDNKDNNNDKQKEESKESENIYSNNLEENNNNDYIDFNKQEEFKDWANIFKTSKISKTEYDNWLNKILEQSSPENFNKKGIEVFGDNFEAELKLYRDYTKDTFNIEEQDKINKLPAEYKTLLIRAVNKIAKDNIKIRTDYGINTTTSATPEIKPQNAKEQFHQITLKIQKGDYRSQEEYKELLTKRLELANKM